MKPIPEQGGGQAEEHPAEDIHVESTNGSDVVVEESGSLDVEKVDKPVALVRASIATRQEWVRAILAILFVLLLALVIIWAFIRTDSGPDTVDLLDRFLPAVTGLLGSVVGFYFAAKQ